MYFPTRVFFHSQYENVRTMTLTNTTYHLRNDFGMRQDNDLLRSNRPSSDIGDTHTAWKLTKPSYICWQDPQSSWFIAFHGQSSVQPHNCCSMPQLYDWQCLITPAQSYRDSCSSLTMWTFRALGYVSVYKAWPEVLQNEKSRCRFTDRAVVTSRSF